MADVIPMAIEGMYDKIKTRSKAPRPSQSLRKQIETERILKKEEREEIRRQFNYSLDQKLFSLKTQKLDMVISPPKKNSGFCCEKCTPSSRSALSDEINANSTMNLLNLEKLESHPKGLLSKLFPHIVHAATFKYFSFPYIYNSVLSDNKIQQTIEDSAKELFESESTDNSIYYTMLKKQRERAAKILTTLRSTFSFLILRLASYTMTKVFKRFFSSVIVNPNHIKMLRKADASNLPLIFLPLHRSHIDYIMLTYILCNNDIKSPLVAAGENLRIPVFGWLLRGLGAFFIKRRVMPKKGEDILYKSVLQTYMVHCLGAGYNFEFYIEGGRTRSGKPCMPKSGLLSIIIDAYMEGTIDDALIIPVSINYERLVEGNFVREQMGDPKPIETFGSAISAIWKALISHYGMMRVDFSQPFSLSEMVGTLQKKVPPSKILHSVPSTASLFGTDVVIDEHRHLVNTIARHVLYDCSSTTAIMSTNIVSFLLLYMFRDGVALDQFATILEKFRNDLKELNKVIGFSGDSLAVINHAVEILGSKLVIKEKHDNNIFIKPITSLPNVIELSYYSNSVLPNFILDAVVARSISTLLKSSVKYISRSDLLEKCQTLCEILQFEFIFTKPCESLIEAVGDTIDKFIIKGILKPQNYSSQSAHLSHAVAENVENCDYDDEMHYNHSRRTYYYVQTDVKKFQFYYGLLQPFIDVYTSSVLNLHQLVESQVTEKDFLMEIISDIKTRLSLGQFQYNECLAVDSIRNSLKLLEKWQILDCYLQEHIKLYYLTDDYNDGKSLVDIVAQIEQYQ